MTGLCPLPCFNLCLDPDSDSNTSEHDSSRYLEASRIAKATQIAADCDFFEFDTFERTLDGEGMTNAAVPTKHRGITLSQLRAVYKNIERRCTDEKWVDYNGQLLTPETVTLYDACNNVILPATVHKRCSFVEHLVGCKPQIPKWFVSHWWGEPVKDFIACLEKHAVDFNLDEDHACYWVCAYANNQWAVGEAVVKDPALTSFHHAMQIADGTVTVLDKAGKVFTRIWCGYEMYVTFIGLQHVNPKYKWAVYTAHEYDARPHSMYRKYPPSNPSDNREAIGLTEGDAPDDTNGPPGFLKRFRERDFPIRLAESAMTNVYIQKAEASKEEDRVHILNRIANEDKGINLDATPPETHPQYDELNAVLKGRFAASCLRIVLDMQDSVKRGELLDLVLQTMKAGRTKEFAISFADCFFNDDVGVKIGQHMPRGLETIKISHIQHPRGGLVLLQELAVGLMEKAQEGDEAESTSLLDGVTMLEMSGVDQRTREMIIEYLRPVKKHRGAAMTIVVGDVTL